MIGYSRVKAGHRGAKLGQKRGYQVFLPPDSGIFPSTTRARLVYSEKWKKLSRPSYLERPPRIN